YFDLPMHFGMVALTAIVSLILAGMNNCFFFRHQAVLPSQSSLKLSNRNFNFLCLFNYLILQIPPIILACAYAETLNGEQYLREFHPEMAWIMDKMSW
ncbi:hypothetical protein PMAYCL1PPCAC_10757, partial [Pristionchus mayeri]